MSLKYQPEESWINTRKKNLKKKHFRGKRQLLYNNKHFDSQGRFINSKLVST